MSTSSKNQAPPYSLGEEIANSISHGIGALASVAGLTLLVTLAALQQDVGKVVSFSVYGGSLVLLFLASTLYHSFQHPRVKAIFKLLDHCAIYVLIAGTYTPLLLHRVPGALGITVLALIWLLALSGIGFKLIWGQRFEKLSLATYLVMGWLSVAVIYQLWQNLAGGGLVLLTLGGLIYSLGVIFYINHRIPFNHAIWHLFVVAAASCHYLLMLWYVLPAVS